MFMVAVTHGSEDTITINFEEYDDVSSAFSTLFSIFQKVIGGVNKNDFQIIQNTCVSQTDEPLCSLLQNAANSHSFFQVLATNSKYCNWIHIKILEKIAHANFNMQLVNLVKNYKKAIFSKSLHEIWSSLPHCSVQHKYYTEVKATFDDKDLYKVTVEELLKMATNLDKEIEMLIAVVQKGSLVVSWLIPTNKVYEAYLSFLTVPQQLRMDRLFEFRNWVAYLPQSVLVEEKKLFGQL